MLNESLPYCLQQNLFVKERHLFQANDGGERDEGTQDSEPDPFGYLTTPINLTGKPDDGETDEAPDTTTPKQKADREAGSTPAETPGSTGKGTKKNKGSKAAASAAVSGTIPLKNPDKIIFNRVSYYKLRYCVLSQLPVSLCSCVRS